MPERTLFSDERQIDRSAVADYLRSVADRLESGQPVTFQTGTDEVTVEVPATVEFEVKVEREGPTGGPGELGLELELEWPEDASDDHLSVR